MARLERAMDAIHDVVDATLLHFAEAISIDSEIDLLWP
jgi:hypothetical protein